MLRLFAGLSLPDAVTARLALTQPGLPGRPVAPETMHLTLAFFGETDEATAGDLHAALGAVRCPGFDLWLDGVGAFGGARPRSIHALARPEPLLTRLHDKVARAAREAGANVDATRFAPHVTLSRLRAGEASPAEVAKALQARAALLAGPVGVDTFHLYRSDLTRGGARYGVLADYPLRDAQAARAEAR